MTFEEIKEIGEITADLAQKYQQYNIEKLAISIGITFFIAIICIAIGVFCIKLLSKAPDMEEDLYVLIIAICFIIAFVLIIFDLGSIFNLFMWIKYPIEQTMNLFLS
jgi:formate/nitrite transporter FocA (FNT family)